MKLHLNRFYNSMYGILALVAGWHYHLYAQGTAFTYQGRLDNNGNPANGLYDFRFKLYFDSLGNTQVGEAFATNGIPATNGLFVTDVDFGSGIFTGTNYWLEVDVRTNGATSYTVLTPLQPVTPTPYAIYANTASNLSGTLPAAQLTGSLSSAQLGGTYNNAVTFTNAADTFAGTFSGTFTGTGSGLVDVWHTGGNLGTKSGTNFLGTTDNQPLELHVNATRVLRLEPDSRGLSAGNVIGGYISNAVVQPGSGSDVIAGGGYSGGANLILSNSSGDFIGAGSVNSVGPNVNDSVIAGGYGNTVQSFDSVVGGGYYNTIQANTPDSFIGGGNNNTIQANAYGAIIGGGNNSTIQTNADHSLIAGGWQNVIQYWGYESVIGGGVYNAVGPYGQYTVIAGGHGNTNSAHHSFIGGGYENTIQTNSEFSVISGGENNVIQPYSPFATIGGGQLHTIQSASSVIGGGYANTIQANSPAATIGGGNGNTIQINSQFATLGGGLFNTIQTGNPAAVIGGGNNNTVLANSPNAIIGGGAYNLIQSSSPFGIIGGGNNNTIQTNSQAATIAGGVYNLIQTNNEYAFMGGGNSNTIQPNAYGAIITGGNANVIQTNADHSVIGGGAYNAVGPSGQFAVIAGGNGNTNASSLSSIGGGFQNMIQTNSAGAVIGGGHYNIIQTNAPDSFIGGGIDNTIQPNVNYSVIGGGFLNIIGTNAGSSVVAGGVENVIQASAGTSVIGGGSLNTIQAFSGFDVIGGGYSNNVGSYGATVPGGINNFAAGSGSFAAGTGAQAMNEGSFVLADYQPTNNFSSTANNQFSARFNGGVRFVTSGAGMTVDGLPVLVGSVAGGQLSGSYTNPVTFNNPADTFVGSTIKASSLVVSNDARVSGLLRSGSESGTAELPAPAGLVVRRINSISTVLGQVLARTDNLTLERDGSNAGFLIRYPASAGNVTIACMGINSSNAPVYFYKALPNPAGPGTLQIYSDAQNIVHFECTFGVTYSAGQHLTQVTLSRYGSDFFWSGNVISTYNQ